jgi:uncharacterized protein YbaR (Trm112 family)
VFIELTDHLRCPAAHDERYLVLLPDRMAGRQVERGTLGCPVCGRVTAIEDGVVDFGGGRAATGSPHLTGKAIAALLGVSGPGGYVALFGAVGAVAPELERELPGVRLVLVNPPAGTPDRESASVIRCGGPALKARTMRGVVIGAEAGLDPIVREAAIGAVLPGNRVVGEGEPPDPSTDPRYHLEIVTTGPNVPAGDRVWVGRSVPPPVRR